MNVNSRYGKYRSRKNYRNVLEDRTPLEAIRYQFGLKDEDAIQIMLRNLKPKSSRVWR